MRIAILQINKDNLRKFGFHSYDEIAEKNDGEIPRDIYNKIYSAEVDDSLTLNDIFYKFNQKLPDDYLGHSLSISDVVRVITPGDKLESGSYFVDDIGFQKIWEIEKQEESYNFKDTIPLEEDGNNVRNRASFATPSYEEYRKVLSKLFSMGFIWSTGGQDISEADWNENNVNNVIKAVWWDNNKYVKNVNEQASKNSTIKYYDIDTFDIDNFEGKKIETEPSGYKELDVLVDAENGDILSEKDVFDVIKVFAIDQGLKVEPSELTRGFILPTGVCVSNPVADDTIDDNQTMYGNNSWLNYEKNKRDDSSRNSHKTTSQNNYDFPYEVTSIFILPDTMLNRIVDKGVAGYYWVDNVEKKPLGYSFSDGVEEHTDDNTDWLFVPICVELEQYNPSWELNSYVRVNNHEYFYFDGGLLWHAYLYDGRFSERYDKMEECVNKTAELANCSDKMCKYYVGENQKQHVSAPSSKLPSISKISSKDAIAGISDFDISMISLPMSYEIKKLNRFVNVDTECWCADGSDSNNKYARIREKDGSIGLSKVTNYLDAILVLRLYNLEKYADLDYVTIDGIEWTRVPEVGFVSTLPVLEGVQYNVNANISDANEYSESDIKRHIKNWTKRIFPTKYNLMESMISHRNHYTLETYFKDWIENNGEYGWIYSGEHEVLNSLFDRLNCVRVNGEEERYCALPKQKMPLEQQEALEACLNNIIDDKKKRYFKVVTWDGRDQKEYDGRDYTPSMIMEEIMNTYRGKHLGESYKELKEGYKNLCRYFGKENVDKYFESKQNDIKKVLTDSKELKKMTTELHEMFDNSCGTCGLGFRAIGGGKPKKIKSVKAPITEAKENDEANTVGDMIDGSLLGDNAYGTFRIKTDCKVKTITDEGKTAIKNKYAENQIHYDSDRRHGFTAWKISLVDKEDAILGLMIADLFGFETEFDSQPVINHKDNPYNHNFYIYVPDDIIDDSAKHFILDNDIQLEFDTKRATEAMIKAQEKFKKKSLEKIKKQKINEQ